MYTWEIIPKTISFTYTRKSFIKSKFIPFLRVGELNKNIN